jgi:hypothetical protein
MRDQVRIDTDLRPKIPNRKGLQRDLTEASYAGRAAGCQRWRFGMLNPERQGRSCDGARTLLPLKLSLSCVSMGAVWERRG